MNTAKTRSIRQRRSDRGAVLMVVLIVMIALLGLGMTGLFLTSGSIQMNTNINLRNQALVVAEAGIERARGILNEPNWVPPLPALLRGATSGADEIPTSKEGCLGEARGAVLIDQITPNCNAAPVPAECILRDVAYPSSLNRKTDMPTANVGPIALDNMGRYTVYIRQDPADCRMGNYQCELSPAPLNTATASSTSTNTVTNTLTSTLTNTATNTATDSNTFCTPPPGAPAPNGAVVVRSEGVASDGRTRVVLEVTMTPSQGAAQAGNTPMSALCASGASGCDDNASVQSGIVVNSQAPQVPPPPPPPGAGGAGGAGGGSVCSSTKCARIAILGQPGIWDPNQVAGDSNSGWTDFRNWLTNNDSGCYQWEELDFGYTTWGSANLITASRLSKYNVLLLMDMYHRADDRSWCISSSNYNPNCRGRFCYWAGASSNTNLCWRGVTPPTATYTSTAYSTDPAVLAGCPKTATLTGVTTRSGAGWRTWTGTATGTLTTTTTGTATASGTVTWRVTQTTTGTGTSGVSTVTATANCTMYQPNATNPTSMNAGWTSYNYGSARKLQTSELDAIEQWVKIGGNGIASTSSYYYQAPEVENVNAILSRFGVKYATSDAAGHIYTVLNGLYGTYSWNGTNYTWNGGGTAYDGGVDVGSYYNYANGDFNNTSEPLKHTEVGGYSAKVDLLQVRSAVPIVNQSLPYGDRNWVTAADTPGCKAKVSKSCPMPSTASACSATYTALNCEAASDLPACVGANFEVGAGAGRVATWADEWLTYDKVWQTVNSCGQTIYQPYLYWENVVRWLSKCGTVQTCGGVTCSSAQTCCNNSCVDTSSSVTNCGACGNSCGAGNTCMAGTCVSGSSCLNNAVQAVGACAGGSGCVNNGMASSVSGAVAMKCLPSSCSINCPSCMPGPVTQDTTSPASQYTTATLPAPTNCATHPDVIQTSGTGYEGTAGGYTTCISKMWIQGGTMNLTAGNYVISSLQLNSGTALRIDASAGPVHLWVNTIDSLDGTVTVVNGSATSFWLIHNGTGFVNNNTNNNFMGVIFAPGAQVNLNYKITGAVLGKNVMLNSNSAVNFPGGSLCY